MNLNAIDTDELKIIGRENLENEVVDTLVVAREKFPWKLFSCNY